MRNLKFCFGFLIGISSVSILQAAKPEWADSAVRYRWEENADYPSFIRFKAGEGPQVSEVYPFLKAALGLSGDTQLRLNKTEKDAFGFNHMEFQQLHFGHPVQGSIYRVHLKDGMVQTMNGRILRLPASAPSPMPELQALSVALTHVGASSYIWENPEEVMVLRRAMNDPDVTFMPQGKLEWVLPRQGSNPAPRLAWKFDLYAKQPLSRTEIYVDVETGEILFTNDLIHTADAFGVAVTMYSGQRDIITDSTGTDYLLRETGRGGGIETYNMQNADDYNLAVDFTDTDNFWDNINSNYDHAGPDGHWGSEMTYDYFLSKHGRNSFDGNGAKMISFIHYDQNYSNAFWNGVVMTYGSGSSNTNPFCTLDVCGHEFSHGVTGNSAGLVYSYESGALNESFSDIFGASIERFARPTNNNWLIGEGLGTFRNMANPPQYNNPDTYLGSYWVTGSGDNGGVHTNSGVQNHWYYLLSDGGSGTNDNGAQFSVAGVGIDTAAMIAYRNLAFYLTPNDQYADARYYAIESASDLFGDCSNPVIQTINAWHAVGIGNRYTGTLVADFFSPDTINCQIPSTVQFQNLSLSALSYEWNFGDGLTSTQENPSHAYGAAGTYTVTLIAHGCNNTHDTIVMPNRIVLDVNEICSINMPGNNSTQTHTACEGLLFDSGGGSNYLDNTFSTTTIYAPGGNVMTFTFQSFKLLAGDQLRVYDGSSATAPLIGTFVGATLPPSFTSTGSAVTFRESTNNFGNTDGYSVSWTCAVAVDKGQIKGFELYPNPASTSIQFSLDAGTPTYAYTLLDGLGRVLRTGNAEGGRQVRLDVADLARGMYYVRVDVDGQRQSKRVVLQ